MFSLCTVVELKPPLRTRLAPRLVHELHAGHTVTPVEKSIARLAFASADAHRVVSDRGRPDLYPN
jgi:hypothetical protein